MAARNLTPNLDPLLVEAIREAVAESGESEKVAVPVLAWLNELSRGGTELSNKAERKRHFDLIKRKLSRRYDGDDA